MSQPLNITVLVVSHLQDDAEKLNQVLRGSGFASRCLWSNSAELFAKHINPDVNLIVVRNNSNAGKPEGIASIARKRECKQPVVVIDKSFVESEATRLLRLGIADLVTLNDTVRLQKTLCRELHLQQLELRVNHSRHNAATIQKQFSSLMNNVPDAIAHVQEGIIVETNKAWQELFGYTCEEDCTALPLMDAVSRNSQGAVKGALVAISKDRWPGEPLTVAALKADGSEISLALSLQAVQFDGEPAVRIAIKPEQKEDKRVTSLMRDAMNKDQSTFLYHRKHFLKLVSARLEQPLERGQRLMTWIRIDNFKEVRDELGVIKSEEVIADFAELLRQRIDNADIAGRFEGTAFTVLMERSTEEDAVIWAKAFTEAVAERVFAAGERTVNMTCSMGICANTELVKTTENLVELSEKTYCLARAAGSGQIRVNETSDEDTRMRNHDAIWAKRLTEALKDNRFRLLHQPIAALDGDSDAVFDILVRLIDEQDQPVAPGEFLPAARRTNMMHAIDRWVIGASIAFSRERQPDLLFVRLSEQSITDKSFTAWLKTMISKSGIPTKTLCFQIPEDVALKYLKATGQLAIFARGLGCRFALEHSGTSSQSIKLLNALPMDFAKIDGSLIANLSTDEITHARTSELVSVAKANGVKTIAEKVQDANTMAALWQLGISYMQGHYVQEPEVVLQETA